MSCRDEMGFNNEVANLEVLKSNGYGKSVKFHNPTNKWQWKRHIGQGVDLVMEFAGTTYYIEESYCDHDYSYRVRWFYQCRLPRFRDVPESDTTHQRVILTNRARNFLAISWLLSKFNILLLTMGMLLSLLRDTVLTTTTTTMTTITTCMPMEKTIDPRIYLDHPKHESWLKDEIERLSKYG